MAKRRAWCVLYRGKRYRGMSLGGGQGFVFWVELASGIKGTLMMLAGWPSDSCPKGGGWSVCREAQLKPTLFLGLLWACFWVQPSLILHGSASASLGRVKVILEEGSGSLLSGAMSVAVTVATHSWSRVLLISFQ